MSNIDKNESLKEKIGKRVVKTLTFISPTLDSIERTTSLFLSFVLILAFPILVFPSI